MNIKITADSTCDLSADILKEYNIAITPLTVIKAGTGYIDGVTITPAEIFAHVAAGGDLCSTSAVSVGEYQEHFTKYAGEYDGVVPYLHQLGLFLYVPPCLHCRGGF